MKKDKQSLFTDRMLENLASECRQYPELADRGAIFLRHGGSRHGAHDMSVEELAEIGRSASFEKLMTSPNLLKWWNMLR